MCPSALFIDSDLFHQKMFPLIGCDAFTRAKLMPMGENVLLHLCIFFGMSIINGDIVPFDGFSDAGAQDRHMIKAKPVFYSSNISF